MNRLTRTLYSEFVRSSTKQTFLSDRKFALEGLPTSRDYSQGDYVSPLTRQPQAMVVDEADFCLVAETHEVTDQARETVIKLSRDILKGAKKSIYDLHRNDVQGAKTRLTLVYQVIEQLGPLFRENPRLLEEQFYRGGLEELVEAECFLHYLETRNLLPFAKLNRQQIFSTEDYIGGVCDFTGELGRHAVHCCIARRFEDVVCAYHLLDQIHGQLLQINFRNKSGSGGDLRQKFDQIKWTLKKLEQLVYDISVREK